MGIAAVMRARDRLLSVDRDGGSVQTVCGEIVLAFHDLCRFELCSVMTTDPDTLLPSGGVVEGFDAGDCAPFWDNELVDLDFNKFNQMARSHDPVATLADAVDGDLSRSPRYQKLYAGGRAADELRTVFVAGSSCLAVGVFVRPADAGVFTPEEVSDVRQLVPIATTVLRHALGRVSQEASNEPPVIVVLDGAGHVTAMTAGGQRVLDDLRTPTDGPGLPSVVQAAATKARWSRTATSLTTRVREGHGRWLRLHVTPIDGDAGAVVLLVETARPDDLVRIMLDSYGLTPRETEIVLHLARGLSFKEIAAEAMISIHTVRDHVKAIYDKAGVNSRGELVATLFSNHVLDRFHSSVQHLN